MQKYEQKIKKIDGIIFLVWMIKYIGKEKERRKL